MGASSSLRDQQYRKRKVVVVGAGFLGSYIAKQLVANPDNQVILASRKPEKLHSSLSHLGAQLLAPVAIDITRPEGDGKTRKLDQAFQGADAVVHLVGILTGSPNDFERIQKLGGENVAKAAKEAGVGKVVMVSALGIDDGLTPYARTKMAAEKAFMSHHPSATIIRPSLVFGPGDSFFTRFSTLAKFLPFLPVFGGGTAKFQPVYVGDIAKAVEIATRPDEDVQERVSGKIIEAGGPEVLTYRQIMNIVLAYSQLKRFVISLPFWLGMLQAAFLERLPESIFTLTRDQVKQLKADNKESGQAYKEGRTIAHLISKFPPPGLTSAPEDKELVFNPRRALKSVHDILPIYIGPNAGKSPLERVQSGKRSHGRSASIDDVQKVMSEIKK